MGLSVLVPDRWGGLTVCDLDQLVAAVEEGEEYDEAVTNSAFDSIMDMRRKTGEQIQNLARLVYRLNTEPGWEGYWERPDD